MTKVNLEELEMAVQYMRNHSNNVSIITEEISGRSLTLKFEDKKGVNAAIVIYTSETEAGQGALRPTIERQEVLTKDVVVKG